MVPQRHMGYLHITMKTQESTTPPDDLSLTHSSISIPQSLRRQIEQCNREALIQSHFDNS